MLLLASPHSYTCVGQAYGLLQVLLSLVAYFYLQSDCIVLKDRKLNIAPAIKKQVSASVTFSHLH
jgi:hypothetical protein